MESKTIEQALIENFPQIKMIRVGEDKGFFEILTQTISGTIAREVFTYKTLTSAGIKEQGLPPKYFFNSPELAWDHYRKEFFKFVEGEIKNKDGTYELVLRIAPELKEAHYHPAKEITEEGKVILEDGPSYCYWVRSRLLIREVFKDEK